MAATDFRQVQRAFAAHLRDPGQHPAPPGVAVERMALYRELFLNNVKHFIAISFPVLRETLQPAQWEALVEDFFARHHSTTPYYAEFPEEFLAFLSEERGGHPDDPPFLLELAHYEWVELALSLADGAAPPASAELDNDPLSCVIALSELAWPLAYRFPVHHIGRDHQPAEPPAEPACLAVYRDRDDAVHFLELNPATFRLLQMLEEGGPRLARDCLLAIAAELGYRDADALLAHGAGMLRELSRRGIIGPG